MLSVARYRMAGGERGLRGHRSWHFCAVLGGGFEEVLETASQVCESGRTRMSRAGARHALTFGPDGADCLIMEASGPFWVRVFARELTDVHAENAFKQAEPALLRSLAQGLLAPGLERLDALETLGGLFGLGPAAPQPSWLEDAHAAMVGADGRVALSRLAATAGVRRAEFSRAFRSRHGYHPREFLALQRLRRAAELLAREPASLADVAYATGYTHQSHMTNAFRNLLGTTPAAFRRDHRAG